MNSPHPLADRFWKFTDDLGEFECWEWRSAKNRKGYARILYAQNRWRPASRVAWEIENGREWPEGQIALHSCDNPGCVNPHHIRPGSFQENSDDCSARGRRTNATPPEIREEIRAAYRFGCKVNGGTALAKRYGICPSTVLRIVNGRPDTLACEVNSLMRAWNRARHDARRFFLNQIGANA